MEHKAELWNKQMGKSILLFKDDYQLELGVVAGCDPNIGICISTADDPSDPIFIMHGPLSTTYDWNNSSLTPEEHRPALEKAFYQIMAGYYSWESIVEHLREILERKDVWGSDFNGAAVCPFSS